MKKIFFIPLFLFFFITVTSQESDFKWFEKDGKIYYNRHVPVYFWVSTSPTEKSQDFLMTSEGTKAYTNPMYFDTEGFNTFRYAHAIDTTTKRPVFPQQQVVFKVYVDGMPPTTDIQFRGTRKYVQGKFIYNTNLEIHLSARDYISGVKFIKFSLDGREYTEYQEHITFDRAGEYELKFFAQDNTGNISDVKTYKFTIE